MKKVAKGLYVLDYDVEGTATEDRHGKDLRKQLDTLRKEEGRIRKTLRGAKAMDAEDHPPTDYKTTEAGTVVPSMLKKKVLEDSHGIHEIFVADLEGGGIPGVEDRRKARYGTSGVTRREIGEDMRPVDVEEGFYPGGKDEG